MPNPSQRLQPLGELLAPAQLDRLEQFFEAPLGAVGVGVAPALGALGCAALARGEQVLFAPQALSRRPPEGLRLLGHELTHVLQQRAGRVRPAPAQQLTIDPALEAEADRCAEALVRGQDRAPLAQPRRRRAPCAVPQPALLLGAESRVITDEKGLSPAVRSALHLVPQGLAWVNWAIGSSTHTWEFSDGDQLVRAALAGLQDTDLLVLNRLGLLVGPLKLLSMSRDDLDALFLAEADPHAAPDPSLGSLLRRNRLATTQQLEAVRGQLARGKLSATLLATTPSLVALADLYWAFAAQPPADAALAQALAFAGPHVTNLRDLGALIQTWFELDPSNPSGAPPAVTPAEAFARLAPATFAALRAPRLSGVLAPLQVLEQVRRWADQGNALGFRSVAAGVLQGISIPGWQSAKAPVDLIAQHCREATEFLRSSRLLEAFLCQDGATARFVLRSDSHEAVLELSPRLEVVLHDYRRRSKQPEPTTYGNDPEDRNEP